MNAQDLLATLKKLGKPQTAAIYKRHGSGDNVFGALTSDIGKLQKKIKVDHALAMELWKTGNTEARVLALQVADPEKVTRADADSLVKDGPVRFLGCYLSALVARRPIAEETMRAWMKSPDDREGDPPLPEPGAVRDERRTYLDRSLQADTPQEGDRGGQAHRQGRGRPRGNELQDARRGSLHREGVDAEAVPVA